MFYVWNNVRKHGNKHKVSNKLNWISTSMKLIQVVPTQHIVYDFRKLNMIIIKIYKYDRSGVVAHINILMLRIIFRSDIGSAFVFPQ